MLENDKTAEGFRHGLQNPDYNCTATFFITIAAFQMRVHNFNDMLTKCLQRGSPAILVGDERRHERSHAAPYVH